MKNFKAKFMGFIKNISEGVIFGNFVATVIFQIFCVFLALIGEPDFFNITAFYLALDVVVIISAIFVHLQKSGSIHKIDADIIGNNFIGFGKKSRDFRKAVEDFCNDDFPKAIDELKDIEEKYNLSDSENGVLCFYMARCYDVMSYYPNALNYYEKTEKFGFSDESIILFKANCIGASGDTEKALSIYKDILNSDNKYSIYVRTYTGKMYLENRQPEKALKWYLEAVEKHENYAMALGGCSLAYLMLGNKEESRKYYQYAIINNMSDLKGFKAYYKEISESLKGVILLYKALYRKWRPLKFDDVISQKHITDTLRNQVINNKTAHAYLFTGSRGTGKTTCARILAKAVNCKSVAEGNPCLECDICRDADNGSLTDIVEIDAASNNGVDDIRELRDATVYTPERCSYKVYIIDEVHMLSPSAFNALLKIMEEPPDYVKFILATTEIHKVPATIVSRCQRYDFRRIKTEDIAKRLLYIAEQENINLTNEGAFLIARLADGGMRDAISLLDQCSVCADEITPESVSDTAGIAGRDYLYDIIESFAEKDISKSLDIINTLYNKSKDLSRLCEELITQIRNIMLIKISPDSAENLVMGLPDEIERLKKISQSLETDRIMSMLDTLQECYVKMSKVFNKRVEFEMTAIRLCRDNPVIQTVQADNTEVLDKIKRLENQIRNVSVSKDKDIVDKPMKNISVEEPKPNIDMQNLKLEEIPKFEQWNNILDELKKANPAVAGSLYDSYAQVAGNVLFITAENRWFINLFKNKETAVSIGETIRRVTGQKYALRVRCLVTKEEQKSMAERLVEKAKNSGIDTAVE